MKLVESFFLKNGIIVIRIVSFVVVLFAGYVLKISIGDLLDSPNSGIYHNENAIVHVKIHIDGIEDNSDGGKTLSLF